MAQLASSFQEYGAWRDSLARGVAQLRAWLEQNELLDHDAGRRLAVALDRLAEDKLVIAFVAEFSRGKSELINAIFFADYGRRILPSSAGRTTMCPTELMYDESLPPCIRALPIETRARQGTMSDFKKASSEWRVFPVDIDAPEGMLEAFKLVSDTVRVSEQEALLYGLYDPADPDQKTVVDADGTLEISRWRHAVINFPHPLLKRGLVILDTPGLNAIGAEPELTLSLVPSAHAVLFVLAADTGVTKSDLEVWRQVVHDTGASTNHIAVLNKIDGLWDGLKTAHEIDGEVERQVHLVGRTLDLDIARVFPVSAQKGLVAKVMQDDRLLAASRLPKLESALVELLVPAKQRIVGSQTQAIVERIAEEVRQALGARERGVIEQLYELRALQGKNQSSIERMSMRAQVESREFEANVRKIVATRVVLSRLSDRATTPLGHETLRATLETTRERMRKVRLTPQFYSSVKDYFTDLNGHLRDASVELAEIEKMVIGVQQKFASELGWSLPPPMSFTLDKYRTDLEQVERASKSHFNAFVVFTRDKQALIERFFESVVARTRDIFTAAERDTEAWIRSLLPPIEAQVREQRSQLKRRAESVERIRDAQESLDSRIGELETALEDVQGKLEALRQTAARVRHVVETAPSPPAGPAPAAATVSRNFDSNEPAFLRVEI